MAANKRASVHGPAAGQNTIASRLELLPPGQRGRATGAAHRSRSAPHMRVLVGVCSNARRFEALAHSDVPEGTYSTWRRYFTWLGRVWSVRTRPALLEAGTCLARPSNTGQWGGGASRLVPKGFIYTFILAVTRA